MVLPSIIYFYFLALGVGAFLAPETAGASLAAGVASKGARMGIKGAFKNAYRATIGAALRAGTERSATFAAARANFAAGRRSLGTAVSKAGGAYARAVSFSLPSEPRLLLRRSLGTLLSQRLKWA